MFVPFVSDVFEEPREGGRLGSNIGRPTALVLPCTQPRSCSEPAERGRKTRRLASCRPTTISQEEVLLPSICENDWKWRAVLLHLIVSEDCLEVGWQPTNIPVASCQLTRGAERVECACLPHAGNFDLQQAPTNREGAHD